MRNSEIAEFAFEKEFYEVANSRYYYAMFLHLLDKFSNLDIRRRSSIESSIAGEMERQQKNPDAATHIKLLKCYQILLARKPEQKQEFTNLFSSVKSLRITADYKPDNVSKGDCLQMRAQVQDLKNLIKIHIL